MNNFKTVISTKTIFDTNSKLSEHFTLQEAVFSQTASRLGIDNTKGLSLVINTLIHTADKMEEVRFALDNHPIKITSWLRTFAVNRAVGSKDSSAHPKGEATDFICPSYGSPLEICRAILRAGISFDQLILEHDWVHVSFKILDSQNRNQVLSLLKSGRYALGLTDKQGKEYK